MKKLIVDVDAGEIFYDKWKRHFGERDVLFLKINGWETQQAICLENYRLASYSFDAQEALIVKVIGRIGPNGKFAEA
jgi:hypothetical protein